MSITHVCDQVSSGLLGMGARKEKQWPTELLPLARALYNLQRSKMLAPQGVHPDERQLYMLQLLGAGFTAAAAQVWGVHKHSLVHACTHTHKHTHAHTHAS